MSDPRSPHHVPHIGMIVNDRLTWRTMKEACEFYVAGAKIDGRVMEPDFSTREISSAEREEIKAAKTVEVVSK